MATLTITSSNWDVGQIRITYTASNGTLKITEIEGKRSGGYRSWETSDTSISVSVGGTSKSISLGHYIDFGNNEWTSWGATDTSWTGLTGTSIDISTTMPTSTVAYSGAKFTGNATMSWSTYTVSYNANGGSNPPSSQTKTYGTTLTLSSTKPTRTGYTFSKWNTKSDGSGTNYNSGASYTSNSAVTLYAQWEENALTVNYYSNYATSSFSDALNTVGSDKNVKVWEATIYYDNDYSTYGLTNYSAVGSSLYMARTGYTATGNWGTSDGTLINENTGYATGQALAKALGKDLSSGNASINLYAQWSENALTVNYYSNYADYGTYQGESLNVSSSSNVKIAESKFLYDNSYANGLSDVQNVDDVYLSRTGYTSTGYWGTSTDGGTLINQKTSYPSGQALAQDFGKSLVSGNVSVNVYPQWKINTYTIGYDGNGGYGSMDIQSVNWQETFVLFDNKFKREGYKFVGWNVQREVDRKWYVNGQGWVTEDEITANRYEKKLYLNQDEIIFDLSWIKGETGVIHQYTMYAIWEISGVVYIDNGTTLEPYLAYIDNGDSWDLYLAYIDDGTEWKIIS